MTIFLPKTADKKITIIREVLSVELNLLETYSIENYIHKLDRLPRYSSYRHISSDLKDTCEQLYTKGKDSLLANYHKLLLLTLIERSTNSCCGSKLPESVRLLWRAELERILAEMDMNGDSYYQYSNDLFLRDLGLSRCTLIPVGVGIVEPVSGVPRSILLRGGVRQLCRGLWFFAFKVRGFRPFCLVHTNTRSLDDFNSEGWDRAYLRIAEILQLNPEMKGMFRSNWFSDPNLERVSPRLAYLRRRLEENGAELFYVGPSEDATTNALAKSATRRRLYEEKQYIPTNYLQVWPREEMIRWAKEFRRSNQAPRN